MSNCKCNTKKPKTETINNLLDNIVEAEKNVAVARLTDTWTNNTLKALAASMLEKSQYGGQLRGQGGLRTKTSNDFVNGFDKILRKRITKMLEEKI